MKSIFKIWAVIACMLLVPIGSYAQTTTSASLEINPRTPEAGEVFTVKLTNIENRKTIQWFINGTEDTSAVNQSTISLSNGDIGSTLNILAKVTLQNGEVVQAKQTVRAHRLDIIIDADTITPPFYKGRNLPSSGSTVTATALLFTKENKSPTAYAYTWRHNGKIQNGGSITGAHTFTFTPGFERSTSLTVDISDTTGKLVASKSISIPIVKPEMYFYEQNPLRGLSFVAVSDPHIFVGDEVTFRGEGYFMDKDIQNNTFTEWNIDGETLSGSQDDPQEVTLTKSGNSGESLLSFHIRNLSQLLQGVTKSITIQF